MIDMSGEFMMIRISCFPQRRSGLDTRRHGDLSLRIGEIDHMIGATSGHFVFGAIGKQKNAHITD